MQFLSLRLKDYFICTTKMNIPWLYKLPSTNVKCFSESCCWIGDWGAEDHRTKWYIVSPDEGQYSNRCKNKEYWSKLLQIPARYKLLITYAKQLPLFVFWFFVYIISIIPHYCRVFQWLLLSDVFLLKKIWTFIHTVLVVQVQYFCKCYCGPNYYFMIVQMNTNCRGRAFSTSDFHL